MDDYTAMILWYGGFAIPTIVMSIYFGPTTIIDGIMDGFHNFIDILNGLLG